MQKPQVSFLHVLQKFVVLFPLHSIIWHCFLVLADTDDIPP